MNDDLPPKGEHFDLLPRGRPAVADVAAGVRSLLDALVRTQVDDDVLASARQLVDRADELLRDDLRNGPRTFDRDGDIGMDFSHNPVVGHGNPVAPPVDFEVRDGEVHAVVTLGPVYEGPPGFVHGGILAMLLDQALGYANVVAGLGGMTRSLTTTYRRPTPLDTELTLWAGFDTVDGRDIISRGTISTGDKVTVEADGVFRRPSRAQGQRYFQDAGNPTPPGMRQ